MLAGSQGGSQALLHPGQKHLAVHGALKQPRSARTIHAYAGDQRAGLIVSAGDAAHQSSPSEGPAAQARHLGVGPAFIHENQAVHGRRDGQLLMPVRSSFGHVRPVLFGGGQSFFYTSSPVAEARDPPWKSGTAGPTVRLTRPAWRRVAQTAVLRAAVSAPRSAACGVRCDESAAPACRAVETAGARGAPRPRKNPKIVQFRECSCLARTVAEFAGEGEQGWAS